MDYNRRYGQHLYQDQNHPIRGNQYSRAPYNRRYSSDLSSGPRPYEENYREDTGYRNKDYNEGDMEGSRYYPGRFGSSEHAHTYDPRYNPSSRFPEHDYRGYSPEDYPAYQEQFRRSNYPDTYRSRMSGYMSEHVGSDSGRRDYNPYTGQGNLYGTHYGLHKGKGPRNYKRPDDRIRDEIYDRLTDDAYIDASDLEIEVQQGEVQLTGTVHEREEKRRAEDIIESISGVVHVENRLRIGSSARV